MTTSPVLSRIPVVACAAFSLLCLPVFKASAQGTSKANVYVQHNFVSDIPGMADVTDPNLVDPWGVSFSAASPFWISNAGKSNATLYNGSGTITPLVVSIPAGAKGTARSSPSGQVNNNTTVFLLPTGARSSFIFATEDGTISAWSAGAASTVMVDNSGGGAAYEGLAIGNSSIGGALYAANFNSGKIDVFDGKWAPATLPGSFQDPGLPSGFAPFNIWNLGGKLYVMYAKQNDAKKRDVAGAGNGFVNVFDQDGVFQKRLISNSLLNSPWGVAIAPATWGAFGGAVLVGNFGDGRINAFDATTGASLGTLQDKNGQSIVNSGLWTITFGNGGSGGDPNTLYFTAGIQNETHGLFGAIAPPTTLLSVVNAASGVAGPVAPGEVVLISGFSIGPSPRVAATIPASGTLGTSVGSTVVTFDGRFAPLLYASASYVAAIVPYEVAGSTSTSVALNFTNQFNTQFPTPISVPVATSAPGLFTLDSSGNGQVVAINQDGTVNGTANAAARGSVVLLYATGEGSTAPVVQDGAITSGRFAPGPILPVTLAIGGQAARVIYAASFPGTVAGIMQIEAIIPSGVTPGAVPVVVTVGTVASQATATLNVK
ncbi:MAG: hypothetical protein JWO19_5250 [Bryobacterales bacterium]|jgi:uncharacterized protein (TIGR03118 family)|nr:hypothetical protein [Bryobacterales bacterium]